MEAARVQLEKKGVMATVEAAGVVTSRKNDAQELLRQYL